jgi:hypothetical protein
MRRRIVWCPLVGLLLLLVACAHETATLPPEEQLPAPGDPTYVETVLKRRAEITRTIRAAQLSLENVQYLTSVREGSTPRGDLRGFRDQSDLHVMRMDREMELMKARGEMARLERRVKEDHGGELPPWWPRE